MWCGLFLLFVGSSLYQPSEGFLQEAKKSNKDFSDPSAFFNDKFNAVPASSFFNDDDFVGMTVPELVSDSGFEAPRDPIDTDYGDDYFQYPFYSFEEKPKSFFGKLKKQFDDFFGR